MTKHVDIVGAVVRGDCQAFCVRLRHVQNAHRPTAIRHIRRDFLLYVFD